MPHAVMSKLISALPGCHEVDTSAPLLHCVPSTMILCPITGHSVHAKQVIERRQKVTQKKSFLRLFDALSPQLPQLSNM